MHCQTLLLQSLDAAALASGMILSAHLLAGYRAEWLNQLSCQPLSGNHDQSTISHPETACKEHAQLPQKGQKLCVKALAVFS